MENKYYVAIGEEAARGTKESTTVGFLSADGFPHPKEDFQEKAVEEGRGQSFVLGKTFNRRHGRSWTHGLAVPFYTEAGSAKGMMGTLLKHLFGHVASAQNGATGQYRHMFSGVADPFATANLGDKALTLNLNLNEGDTMKCWPFVGGRVKALNIEQAAGSPLKATFDMMGQFRDAVASEIGTPSYPAESIICKMASLKLYSGTITRTGTGPDFTQFGFGSAVQIKPDKLSVKIENGMEDVVRASGKDYPDKTRMGQFKASIDMTLDWDDPASGFSSVDEFNNWVADAADTNFCAVWDTGTQAGTGDNHMLIVDIPIAHRLGGDITYASAKTPLVNLKYEALLDATTCKYLVGIMLKNTASAV